MEEKKLLYKPMQMTLKLLPLSICCLELLKEINLITFLGIEGIGPKRAQALAREYKTLDNLLELFLLRVDLNIFKTLMLGRTIDT